MADKNKKKKFSLKKLIYNDKYLIVFSIIAAVIVWVSTSMSLSPETTKTITVAVNVDSVSYTHLTLPTILRV